MRAIQRYLTGVFVMAAAPIGIFVAPQAAADCIYAGGVTVCAQGEVRGGGGGDVVSGPVVPYPCEYDWLCDTGGISIIINPNPPQPPRPPRPPRPPIIDGGGGVGPG